ncbi:hypothetical protein HY229_05875 [Candidatus Acetothermia bacterium]|nr:hypothetical protein [Candidatus Acetothermia bacterium]MBI3643611.1 hypothetical protein [Candidatus Acetothermia bacterium]
MGFVWKLFIGLGIFIVFVLLLALASAGFLVGELKQHGISGHSSYSKDHEYLYSEASTQDIYAKNKEKLIIKDAVGKIEITGWGGDSVQLQATKRADTEEILKRLEIAVTKNEDEIQIRSGWDEQKQDIGGAVDYVLKVPDAMEISINQGVGELHLGNLNGAHLISIDMGVGKLEVVDVTMMDDLKIDMGLGDLFIKGLDAPMTKVKLDAGRLDLRLRSGGSYMVEGKVGVGDLSISGIEFPGVKISHHGFFSRTAKIMLGEGDQHLTLEVGMGDLSIAAEKE